MTQSSFRAVLCGRPFKPPTKLLTKYIAVTPFCIYIYSDAVEITSNNPTEIRNESIRGTTLREGDLLFAQHEYAVLWIAAGMICEPVDCHLREATQGRGRHGGRFGYYRCQKRTTDDCASVRKDDLEESFSILFERLVPKPDFRRLFVVLDTWK